jgi:hypothetical protein
MTTVSTKSQTLQQRLNQVVQKTSESLHLHDPKILTLAIAEAAASLVNTDATFAERVSAIYDDISSSLGSKTTSKTPKDTEKNHQRLIPLKKIVGREFDITAAPDPNFLLELYGEEQLPLALGKYTLKQLQEGASVVEQRFPGTKPKGKTTKADLIKYMISSVVGSN